uniref:PH domain-containing protein n=1 Tax=Agromyces sp. NPDC058484 TaxID=3346524 RepID=UPI00366161D0
MSPAASQAAAQPATPAERVVARVRRHARMLILPALLLIAVAGGVAYGLAVLPEPWQSLAVAGVALLVVFLGSFLPFLAWLTRRATITTRRIILRSGVFTRVRQELLHSRGYDVTVRRTWWQGAFGSGDVRITTGHDRPVVLRDVPRPRLVQAALEELMEDTRTHGGDPRRVEPSVADGDTVAWGGR